MLFSKRIHRLIFILGIAISVCAMLYSKYLLSIGLIAIIINWLLERRWRDKWKFFLRFKRETLLFLLVYFSVFFSITYSNSITSALVELRIWLPLLIIPIVFSSSEMLTKKEFVFILLIFCCAVLASTIEGFIIYYRDYSSLGQNVRYLSPHILHIRLSIFINTAIFILIYLAATKRFIESTFYRLVLIIVSIWLIVFLFILQSLTGISIFFMVVPIVLIWSTTQIKGLIYRVLVFFVVFCSTIFIIYYLFENVERYYLRQKVDFKNLPVFTANGNKYFHDTTSRQYENGNFINIYISKIELERGWNKVSCIPFKGLDKSGQLIESTLIRYLTSKGLNKDSLGLAKLDSIDVKLIENGVSSVIFREHKAGVYPRLYQFLWEVDQYREEGVVSGSSIVQRFIYVKSAWQIIKDNPLFGVGLGDVKDVLFSYYKEHEKRLSVEDYKRPHNQFVTIIVGSGFFGIILFLIGFFYPFIKRKAYNQFLPFVFIVIITLSMFSLETLEAHIGASFVALFYSIFIFGFNFEKDER